MKGLASSTKDVMTCNKRVSSTTPQATTMSQDICQRDNEDEHQEVAQENCGNLHRACEEGKLCVVRKILSRGIQVDINCLGKFGRNPVMAAARHGHAAVFYWLVRQGYDLSAVDDYNNTVLHLSCMTGNTDIVSYLIENETLDIERRAIYGRTPVMVAAFCGQRAVFDIFVAKGCNLTSVPDDGYNILHFASKGGNVDIVRFILSQEIVAIDSRGDVGITAVMRAAKMGHTGVFDLLVREGCNVSLVNDRKYNILHVACRGGHVDIVKHIVSLNIVSVESRGCIGATPVMMAVFHNHSDVFHFLESKGCNLEAVDNENDNILHYVCFKCYIYMVEYILTKRLFGIESRGNNAWTPILMAAYGGCINVLDFLSSKSGDMKVIDATNNNILHVACDGGHVSMVEHILKREIVGIHSKGEQSRTPSLIAAKMGHIEVLELLAKYGSNLKAVDNQMNNILHLACSDGRFDMVNHILSEGIVGVNTKNNKNWTPVMTAAYNGHVHVFELLSKYGCNKKTVDRSKRNVLHVACSGGNVGMVKHIISQNIFSIECKDRKGMTPAMKAARAGCIEVFDLLVSKGCNPRSVDHKRNNILHFACMGGHIDMVKHILKMRIVDGMENDQNKFGRTPMQVAQDKGKHNVEKFLSLRILE